MNRAPQGQDDQRSSNPDFGKLCKSLFRLVQLKHHQGNWKTLPKGISRGLQRVVKNITPPMPDPELSDKLVALSLEFGDKVSKAVYDHIGDSLNKVRTDQGFLDNSDAQQVREVVDRQLRVKLGRRLTDARRNELLDEAIVTVHLPRLSGRGSPSRGASGGVGALGGHEEESAVDQV